MASAGITPTDVGALIEATGATAIRASASVAAPWPDPRIAAFGFGPATARQTDTATVAALRTAMSAASRRL